MKKIYIFMSCIFLNLIISYVWASPATNLQLAYNVDAQTIHIEADHPTDRVDRHYIHTVTVIRNSQDKQNFYFTHQTSSDKFVADLDYKVSPGDHIDIELYCIQGGKAQGSLDIAMPVEIKESHEQKTISSGK